MNKEKITINYKEWQEIMKDYKYQTEQASKYLLEAQKYSCELGKYKSLYQNEKSRNETLKIIINKSTEKVYDLIDDCSSVIGNKESSIVSKNELMIMQKEKLTAIYLELLREVK